MRKPHKHDDVQYHLFVVVEATFEVTIASDAPVQAPEVRTFFFKTGTIHGFKNIGSIKAAAMEMFVRHLHDHRRRQMMSSRTVHRDIRTRTFYSTA